MLLRLRLPQFCPQLSLSLSNGRRGARAACTQRNFYTEPSLRATRTWVRARTWERLAPQPKAATSRRRHTAIGIGAPPPASRQVTAHAN